MIKIQIRGLLSLLIKKSYYLLLALFQYVLSLKYVNFIPRLLFLFCPTVDTTKACQNVNIPNCSRAISRFTCAKQNSKSPKGQYTVSRLNHWKSKTIHSRHAEEMLTGKYPLLPIYRHRLLLSSFHRKVLSIGSHTLFGFFVHCWRTLLDCHCPHIWKMQETKGKCAYILSLCRF